jgi:hypothetical protein
VCQFVPRVVIGDCELETIAPIGEVDRVAAIADEAIIMIHVTVVTVVIVIVTVDAVIGIVVGSFVDVML